MQSQEFDRGLSDAERQSVAAAYAMIDTINRVWRNPQDTAWQALEMLLAPDFVAFTPTSDPDRQQRLDKSAFIDSIRNSSPRIKSESRLDIVARTAHGNRVATAMNSELLLADGSSVRNRYHQLFLFAAPGKIAQYRTYMDSAAIVDSAIASGETLIRSFVEALGGASPELKNLAAAGFAFHPADGSGPLAADAVLAKMSARRGKDKSFQFSIMHGGLVVDQGVASAELTSSSGSQYSWVINFDHGRVTSVIEFSSGVMEV